MTESGCALADCLSRLRLPIPDCRPSKEKLARNAVPARAVCHREEETCPIVFRRLSRKDERPAWAALDRTALGYV
jgi:hypothetical protein